MGPGGSWDKAGATGSSRHRGEPLNSAANRLRTRSARSSRSRWALGALAVVVLALAGREALRSGPPARPAYLQLEQAALEHWSRTCADAVDRVRLDLRAASWELGYRRFSADVEGEWAVRRSCQTESGHRLSAGDTVDVARTHVELIRCRSAEGQPGWTVPGRPERCRPGR